MTPNRLILALVAILAIGVGGYLAYDNVLRGDDTAPLALATPEPERCRDDRPEPPPRAPRAVDRALDHDVRRMPSPARGPSPPTARPATASASSSPTCDAESDAVGRTNDVTGSITVVETAGGAQLTAGDDRRRHDDDHLRRGPARQPAADRGPPDRSVPDRHVRADPAGRRAGRRARRYGRPTSPSSAT